MGVGCTLRDASIVCSGLVFALFSASCDPPGTYQVTTTSDGVTGSLRAAIRAANASSDASVRIELPQGSYELTRCGSDDRNARGDLDLTIDKPVTIVATAPGLVVIRQTCAGERVLQTHGSQLLTLEGVTIAGGSVVSADPAQPAQGGGVRARGSVLLRNVLFLENSVTGAPGRSARAGQAAVAGGTAQGGGLFTEASLNATESKFTSNVATGGAGTAASTDDGIASSGGSAEGGGAYVGGLLHVTGGSLSENRAVGGDGGRGPANPGGGGAARGGAIAQNTAGAFPAELLNATLSANMALGGASGAGNGFVGTGLPAAGAAVGGAVAASGNLSASNVIANQNVAKGGNAGVSGCIADTPCYSSAPGGVARGGALASQTAGVVTAGTYAANQVTGGSGYGACNGRGCSPIGVPAAPAEGGAVWTGTDLDLNAASFTDNKATQGGGLPLTGGLARGGAAVAAAQLSVEGGTFTGNAAVRGHGGAISGGTLTVRSAAFTSNTAGSSGGAIHGATVSTAFITATQNKAGGIGGGAIASTGDAEVVSSRIADNSVDSSGSNAGGGGVHADGALHVRFSEISGNYGSTTRNLPVFGTVPGTFTGGGVRAASIVAEHSTIARNEARGLSSNGGLPIPPGQTAGGGLASTGSVSLLNVTVSENRLTRPSGIPQQPPTFSPNVGAAVSAATLAIEHATIADNAGAESLAVEQLTAHRSAVTAPAGNTVCAASPSVSTGTYNHFSDATCALSGAGNEQSPAEFLLGPVTDNGGPVPTRRPAYASVLVDRVPAAACPVAQDARGVARPQGSACDIGAVEVEALQGAGGADFRLTFLNPPASATPGADGTWQLTIRNQGPNPAAPAVRIDVPAGVTVSAASATGDGACTTSSPALCVWSSALAAGAEATITLTAHVDASATTPIAWSARVLAPALQAPFEDDEAELTTVLAPRTGITMTTSIPDNSDRQFPAVVVELRNAGPSAAVGTVSNPIQVVFTPAPGVLTRSLPEPIVGTFPPSDTPFATVFIGLVFDGPVPAQVGTLELLPGANVQPPLPPIGVLAADLELRAFRTPGVQASGVPVEYRFEVENRGPTTALDVTVTIQNPFVEQPQWSPHPGSTLRENPGSLSWTIPVLGVGQTATLAASASVFTQWATTYASVVARTIDPNPENDFVSLSLSASPGGTADLELSTLQAYRGSTDTQRVLRATIINAGPVTSQGSGEQPIVVSLTQLVDAHPVDVRALSDDWACSFDEWTATCETSNAIAASSSVSFEFVLEGTFPDTHPRLGVKVVPGFTPDHDPNDNTRFVNAANPL